ncbi:MAG: radical SAM protein [Elusimicrobiota bacterium]
MLLIETGFHCNNSCLFCAQGTLRETRPQPESREVLGAIARALIPSAGTRSIAFIGGEPTLREELPGWISHAKNLGAERILVQTNGRRLIYADFVQRLAAAGLNVFDISLHGSTATMHDYHTGISGSWLQTIAGMRQARKFGIPFGITTVVTRSNFRNLSEIAALAAAIGAKALRFNQALILGRAARLYTQIVPAEELVRPYLKDALQKTTGLGLACIAQGRTYPKSASNFFALLGETQPAPASQDQKSSVLTSTKARPGLAEIRGHNKKTGEELRLIFPHLFKKESRASS